MRKIVLAGHGNIAEGLKSSASLIVGAMADSIITYALNPGGSATDFAEEVNTMIVKEPETEFIVLTDLFGASVFNAFVPLHTHCNFYLFTGMNLGLLLSLMMAESPFSKETAQAIITEVRESLLFFEGFGDEGEDNDF